MKKIFGYALLGLLVFILTALFISPRVIKNYLVKNSKEIIGRQIAIDKLSINYFNGKLSVYNFKMLEENQEDVFVAFDTLVLNTVPYKYLSNTIALDQFYLDGLTVNLSNQGNVYNFDDLIEFYATDDSTKTNTKVYKYLLNNLELNRASINFYDAEVDHTTSLKNFAFYIPQIYWNQENQSEADLEFQIADGGNIKADFQMHPMTKDFNGTINLTDLQLKSYYKYITQYAAINDITGLLGTTINFKGNSNSLKDLHISSEVFVDNFEMLDKDNNNFLAAKRIFGDIRDIDFNKKSISFESVFVDQPYINFELDSLSNNFYRIFYFDEESVASTDTTQTTKPLDYFIDSFKVTNGIMDYSDNLTGTTFNYHFDDIKVNSENISNTKDWIEFKADMILNKRGTLKADIGINPQKSMTAQVDVIVENFLLSDLDIYSNYYTGHSFLVGDMKYYSSTKLTNGNLNSSNRLVIDNVDVKNNKGGIYTLPLKFAIWILKDKNGTIELEVPVAGNLNDPQVDTWALVWATLKKRIFNATNDPVKPLARYLKVKPEEIEILVLNYPDTLITTEQANQLDLILTLEKEKEEIEITMDFLADPAIINQIIAEQHGIVFQNDSIQYLETSNEKVQDSLNIVSNENIYSEELKLLDSLTNLYSEAVIRNVANYLKEKNPTTRIKVQKAKVSNYHVIDAKPQLRVYYSTREEDEEEPLIE